MTLGIRSREVLRVVAFLLSIGAALLSLLAVMGWGLDIASLRGPLSSSETMKPNTALAILLGATGLATLCRRPVGPWAPVLATLLGLATLSLGTLSLAEVLFDWSPGIEPWLFQEGPGQADPIHPGRITPASAFCLALVGIGIIFASGRSALRARFTVISAISVGLIIIAGVAFFGHLLFGAFNVVLWNYTGLSLHTSAVTLLVGGALLAWVLAAQGLSWWVEAKTTAGFIVGVVAILAAAGETYIFTAHLREDVEAVSHSQEVLKEIGKLAASQDNLTISLGRYLITHEETAIADRNSIRGEIQQEVDDIRRLTAGNPQQQDRIQEVLRLTDVRFALSNQIISLAQRKFSADRARAAGAAGVLLSSPAEESPLGAEYPGNGRAIEDLLAQMERHESALLQQRESQSQVSSRRTFLLMPVGTYLSVTVLLLCLLLVNTRTENERLAEDARSELESYFRAMFDVIPDGIILTNAERKITMANPAAESMFGYPAGSLCGVGVDSLMPGTLQPEVARERELLLESRTGKSMGNIWQTEGTRLNGSTFPVEFARSSLTTPHGSFILGVARDVTERSLTEEARARMAAIVESSDDAIIGKDLNGIVSSWNPGAEKIFGYSAAEMIGQPILKVVPSDRVQEEADILEHLGRGESIEHAETKRLTKDGRLIDVAISVSPIRNATGKVIGGSKIARDITTSKHLEQQLHQSQKMEAIGQLTGGVAHDFNNLLGVVIGNLDLIERAVAGNEPIVNRVQNAQRAALRGADLTRRMLSFSSRQPLHATATSVAESAENTIEMTKRALGPEIEVSANLDPSIPLVLVDPSGLENALLNLTLNARDAMPKGGSIVISARISDVQASYPSSEAQVLPSGRYVAVSVTDTGEGMSQETLERAFEPFFTTKPRGKGTGLGLAMVYGFAKQSGGTARIYSEVGHGTTVTLYLPLAAEVTAESQLIAAPKVQLGRGQLVMVVDDEVDLLDVAVAYLEDMGYRVVHAPDGATALAVLDSEPDVALLVTDVIMPGMDGVELARRVRQASPGVKIVYSSGFPADALSQRNGTRIDGPLLNKPYQRSEFAAVIRLAMSGAGAPTSLVSSGA